MNSDRVHITLQIINEDLLNCNTQTVRFYYPICFSLSPKLFSTRENFSGDCHCTFQLISLYMFAKLNFSVHLFSFLINN